MATKIRSTLSQTTKSLVPQWPHLQEFRRANEAFKEKQKANYDHLHRVHDLPAIPDHTDVWVTTGEHNTQGRIVNMANTPRSYIVQTPNGEIRKNRSHLNIVPSATKTPTKEAVIRSPIMTRSQTGTAINPPNRL